MSNEKVKIIGDVVQFHGEDAARICLPTGIVRDQFVARVLAEDNAEFRDKLIDAIRESAEENAKAKMVTLAELEDIFDKVKKAFSV